MQQIELKLVPYSTSTSSLMQPILYSSLNLSLPLLLSSSKSNLLSMQELKKNSLQSASSKKSLALRLSTSWMISNLFLGFSLNYYSSMPQYLSSILSISIFFFYYSWIWPLFLIKSAIRLKAKGFLSINILSSFFWRLCLPENKASRALPFTWQSVDFLMQKSSLPPTLSATISSNGYIYAILNFSFSQSFMSWSSLFLSSYTFSYSVLIYFTISSLSLMKSCILLAILSLNALNSSITWSYYCSSISFSLLNNMLLIC